MAWLKGINCISFMICLLSQRVATESDTQFNCTFDSGLCGWTQDATDSFDWRVHSGSTDSSDTGPSSDHTTGSGQYIYIETSSPQVQGDIARLTSPEIVARGMKCLQFYYHMYGSTIDTLNVYVSKVGDPLGIPVFQIEGEQGNSWNLTQVDIMRADTDRFVVTLEGICGSSYTGDIAIDDIIMFSGSCSQGQVRLVNGNEPNEGRVEVLYNGVWGTVCDDRWDINDGRVVCRSLGYRDVISTPRYAHFGQGYGSIWMDNVHCSGDEAHIFDCPHNGFGNHNCGHSEDASVICDPDEQTELACDSTSMTLILDRNLLEIGDDAGDVHFEDESCVGYDHANGHVAITTTYDRCGTTQEESDDYIVYNNVVTYYKPRLENGTDGVITREKYLRIPITCMLEREQVLGDSFVSRTGVVSFSEEEYGEFSLSLDRYTSSSFYEHANDSGEVVLGTPLYYGVHLTAVTNLTLLIDSCWATTSLNPVDDYRHDIIEQGCAVDSTTYIYSGPSPTFKRFRVDAFTFIRDYEKVYVHCSILVCDNEDPGSRCTQGCLSRARRSLQPVGSRSKPHTITNGPLSDASHFQQNNMVDENGGVENLSPSMIATVTALCVFIALTVIMSMMMMRMRRNRQELNGYRRVGVVEEDN